jgi:hypothetical protein
MGGLLIFLNLNSVQGTLFTEREILNGDTILSLACGDFNNDGKPDLAAGLAFAFGIATNKGNGAFSTTRLTTDGTGAGVVLVGDVKNDGNLDLLGRGAGIDGKTTYVLLGNGGGGFSQEPRGVPRATAHIPGRL